MTKINDITLYIYDLIRSNKDILKLLYYTDNSKNPLNEPDLTREQYKYVTKNNIFTVKRVPSSKEPNMQCYISMRYGRRLYQQERNSFFNGSTFYFYIICHSEYDTNEIIGSRVCELESLISDTFNNADIGATCRTRIIQSSDIDVNGTDYSGRCLEIAFYDFNNEKL